jgi:hypothetical protein
VEDSRRKDVIETKVAEEDPLRASYEKFSKILPKPRSSPAVGDGGGDQHQLASEEAKCGEESS